MKEFFLGFLTALIIITFTMLIKAIFEKHEDENHANMYAVIDLDTGKTIGIEVTKLVQDDRERVVAVIASDGNVYWKLNDEGLFTQDERKARDTYR